MYYCISCGAVIFYNRPNNPEKSEKAYISITCRVCESTEGYRKILPEFLNAANLSELTDLKEIVESEHDREEGD